MALLADGAELAGAAFGQAHLGSLGLLAGEQRPPSGSAAESMLAAVVTLKSSQAGLGVTPEQAEACRAGVLELVTRETLTGVAAPGQSPGALTALAQRLLPTAHAASPERVEQVLRMMVDAACRAASEALQPEEADVAAGEGALEPLQERLVLLQRLQLAQDTRLQAGAAATAQEVAALRREVEELQGTVADQAQELEAARQERAAALEQLHTAQGAVGELQAALAVTQEDVRATQGDLENRYRALERRLGTLSQRVAQR